MAHRSKTNKRHAKSNETKGILTARKKERYTRYLARTYGYEPEDKLILGHRVIISPIQTSKPTLPNGMLDIKQLLRDIEKELKKENHNRNA